MSVSKANNNQTGNFDDTDAITKAMSKAVREAVRRHKLLGNPIAVGDGNGGVVILQPDEIELEDEINDEENHKKEDAA